MTQIMEYWAGVGKSEHGGNNKGPFVEMIQRADTLPGEVYAWCQATLNAAHRLSTGGTIRKIGKKWEIVGGSMLAGGTASVGFFLEAAKQRGWVVKTPARGDAICFHHSPGGWPFHVGMVCRVISLGPFIALITVEGNTSWESAVVRSDPGTGADGVVKKRRVVRRSLVSFVRVPTNAVMNFVLPTEWGK
jgi:hypothetical protein